MQKSLSKGIKLRLLTISMWFVFQLIRVEGGFADGGQVKEYTMRKKQLDL